MQLRGFFKFLSFFLLPMKATCKRQTGTDVCVAGQEDREWDVSLGKLFLQCESVSLQRRSPMRRTRRDALSSLSGMMECGSRLCVCVCVCVCLLGLKPN